MVKGRAPTSGSWKPGQSGNPAGRPRSGRALTEILAQYGNRRMAVKDEEEKRARKIILADLVWQVVTTGVVVFPDGRIVELEIGPWKDWVRWLYRHVDGDAPQHIQMEDISDYEQAAAAVRDAIVNGNDSTED